MSNSIKRLNIIAMRSPCPIANTLDIIGDKWTLLVVRDLFAGKSRYGEFQSSPERIPTNILASRLKMLVENCLVEKKIYQERPKRYAYTLTEKGKSLGPVLKALKQWGLGNIKDTHARIEINL